MITYFDKVFGLLLAIVFYLVRTNALINAIFFPILFPVGVTVYGPTFAGTIIASQKLIIKGSKALEGLSITAC